MIYSMTAFAGAQKQTELGVFSWEIRALNHRYLDLSFRLPDAFRPLEEALREGLKNKVSRGKIECNLKFQSLSAANQSMLINKGMIHALVDVSGKLANEYQLANDLSLSTVLTWPGVVQEGRLEQEELSACALSVFEEALLKLCAARAVEGEALQAFIEQRLQLLITEINKANTIAKALPLDVKDKLLSRLQAVKMEVNEARLEQEIALLLTRLDVSEELDRLQTHCADVTRTLHQDKIAGRRLDFLMQELNREANTLSSKSDSIALRQCALEMKVLIEQMREQIQNIE